MPRIRIEHGFEGVTGAFIENDGTVRDDIIHVGVRRMANQDICRFNRLLLLHIRAVAAATREL